MFATLAGSYPQPADGLPGEALRAVLEAQADAGLGLLSDGLVHASDETSFLVAAWEAAREAAASRNIELPIKLAVLGPWARSANSAGSPLALLATARAAGETAADRLGSALAAVLTAGCPVVEVHEPAATLPMDKEAGAAFAAVHCRLLAGMPPEGHATLAITGGDAEALGADAVFAAPYHSHLFDLVAGPESWRTIARAPGERGIIVGVGDASGVRDLGLEEMAWAAGYAASIGGRGMARVALAPSGGLAGLDPARARALLDRLGEAARLLVGDPDRMLRRFDPRAVDLRSAALGVFGPDPRGRRPGGP